MYYREEISVKFDNVIAHEESKADNPLEEIDQPVYRVADVTSKKVSDIFEDNGPVYRSKKACSLEHVAQFGAAEIIGKSVFVKNHVVESGDQANKFTRATLIINILDEMVTLKVHKSLLVLTVHKDNVRFDSLRNGEEEENKDDEEE